MVRFPASDRRPSWRPDEMDEAVRDFAPGRVELLDGHNDTLHSATVIGYLDAVRRTPEGIRFAGVLDEEVMIERLQRERALAVSSEYRSRTPGLSLPWQFLPPKTPPPGYLYAVAILRDGEEPAFPGSLVWPAEDID